MHECAGENCGVFGIYGTDAYATAHLIYTGLYTLQHRGQESAGIAVSNNHEVTAFRKLGFVRDVFSEDILSLLRGRIGIGHVRYSTTGSSDNANAQPLASERMPLAIAHNGNVSNYPALLSALSEEGFVPKTTTDTEVILHLIEREMFSSSIRISLEAAVAAVMERLRGAYSVVLVSASELIAFRDPAGMRPLCIGRLGDAWVVSSETCALDTVGAEYLRDVAPGEIIVIGKDGLRSVRTHCKETGNLCVFEFVYTARADSVIDGQSVYESRREAGRILARMRPVDADIVIGVPESGIDASRGYSQESGIPLGRGLVINRYVGRTFIIPGQQGREDAVNIKLNAIRAEVFGKRIVIVDDSIIRGTTLRKTIQPFKLAGAREIHLRIASPPFLWPCYFGTDVPDRERLIAANRTNEDICAELGIDSLEYLPAEELKNIVPDLKCGFCDACFTGNYPVPLT